MERTPVDGVVCVVWFNKGIVIFARYDACHNAWCEGSGIMRSHKYVTHWTTLDEAKAAPELVEAGRAVVDDYNKACEEKYDEMKWDVFGGVQPLAFALAKIGATHATP
jgi:hypothetical protein